MDPDTNPLFDPKHYNLPSKKDKVVEPLPGQSSGKDDGTSPAVELIRQKIQNIYSHEPDAKEEEREAEQAGSHRSKHQQYMYKLSTSGKSLAEIQTAWHTYYVNLSDTEKHEVWKEFYQNHSSQSHYAKAQKTNVQENKEPHEKNALPTRHTASSPTSRSMAGIKEHVLKKVASRTKLQKKDHLKSLAFGLGMGGVVVIILLFSFFNERFIAPFITPSKSVSSTSIVINPADAAVGPEPKIVIPKINVEAPVIFDEPSIEEKAVQRALENGVLHYATTPSPGEIGNGAIFGHSSGNIFNSGKYKFAFILLKSLSNGDVFYVHKDGKRFAYKVFEKKIVRPEEVSVLNSIEGKRATMTLITCDPPGTAVNRLVVVGEQISPDPGANVASAVNQNDSSKPVQLPSNSPSLWSRLWGWLTS